MPGPGRCVDPDNDDLMEWSPGNAFNGVTIPAGATECGVLRWDSWPVTSQDYDLFLLDASFDAVASSLNDQASSPSEPTEGTCYTNTTGATAGFYWAVVRYSATVTPRFDFVSQPESAGIGALGFSTPDSNVTEPATSPAALAVGATCAQNGALEPYSSRGPTIDGRVKPDLTAPDGVSGTVYGDATGCANGTGFDGTSASAPHVAGAAALLSQARPGLSVDQLQTLVLSEFSGRVADNLGGGALWLHAPSFAAPIAHGGNDLSIVNGDGTNATVLASGGPVAAAAISPDGTKVAFSAAFGGQYQIYVANIDGTGRIQLTNGAGPAESPAWSPDGTKLAYDEGGAISIRNANGTGTPTLLTTGAGPSWHGSKVAFTDVVNESGFIHYDVFSINADGTGRTNLTNHFNATSDGPAWSPNGAQVAFDTSPVPAGIYLMNADGSNIHSLLGGFSVRQPSWSADGTKLVLVSSDDLITVNADGTGQIALTKTPFNQEMHPSWSLSAVTPFAPAPAVQGQARIGALLYAPQPPWIGAVAGEHGLPVETRRKHHRGSYLLELRAAGGRQRRPCLCRRDGRGDDPPIVADGGRGARGAGRGDAPDGHRDRAAGNDRDGDHRVVDRVADVVLDPVAPLRLVRRFLREHLRRDRRDVHARCG